MSELDTAIRDWLLAKLKKNKAMQGVVSIQLSKQEKNKEPDMSKVQTLNSRMARLKKQEIELEGRIEKMGGEE